MHSLSRTGFSAWLIKSARKIFFSAGLIDLCQDFVTEKIPRLVAGVRIFRGQLFAQLEQPGCNPER
ncbi:MAG TPA: hypothetical protein DIT40_10635 [Alphaproteobacteria bacterium]|nr:hypothetical protein [Alphaproteobacteria bacterium]